MSSSSAFNRGVLLVALVLSGTALAQPANDACANAAALTPGPLGVPTVAPAVDITAATRTGDPAFSCQTTVSRSIWYTVTPAVTGLHRIETCAPTAPGNTVPDTVLALYTGACGSLTELAGGCSDDACATRSSLTLQLTAGTTYYLQAAKFSTTAPTAAEATLQVSATLVDPHTNDVCSAASPVLTLNRTALAETSGTLGTAPALDQSRLPGDGGCLAGVGNTDTNAPGRDVPYRFSAPAAGRYSFRLGPASVAVNSALYLSNSCSTTPVPFIYEGAQCLAASNRTGSATTAHEQLSCVSLAQSQEVFVWVDEATLSGVGSSLALEVTPCIEEVEPNDTPVTASSLSCATTGRVAIAGDVDFYAVGSPPAGTRLFAMAEAAASNNNDFDMRVTSQTSTIEYDNADLAAGFGASAPVIAGAVLPGVPVFLRVNHNSATVVAEPYVIYSALQAGTAVEEIEPNNTFATATVGGGFFSGSIADGGNEVDLYRVTANEGDVIFAALDQVPDKRDAGQASYSYVMQLVDSTGIVLATADDTNTTNNLTVIDGGLTSTSPAFPGDGLIYRARVTGDYAVRVGKTSGTNPSPYLLNVTVGCSATAPTISSITPTSGSPAGGATVTLNGSDFGLSSVVRFGSGYATIQSLSATQLVVTTPASAPGSVAVTVTNGVGLTATAPSQYSFEDPPGPPTLTSISPARGPFTGGTVVTLTGTVFRANPVVEFEVAGTVYTATNVTLLSTTQLTATTIAAPAGVADVRIRNTDTLSSTLPAAFIFDGPPTVTSITPNTGFTSGGQTITLAGSNFRAGTTVRFGANLATGVTPAPDGLSLTAITPSNAASGAVNVVVTTTDAQTVTVTGGFTYVFNPPTLTTISPPNGFASGNTLITLTGANFLTLPTVTVGGVPATSVNRISATSVTARTPAGTPGTVPVVLTNSDGQLSGAVNFTYVAAPAITAISPTSGPVQGGTRITITGADFVSGARVTINGVPAFAVAVSSATSLMATTNTGSAGVHDVVVTNPDTQSATLADGFTLEGAPSLVLVNPVSGSTAGGTVVTLTGTGFHAGAAVLFGSTPATAVTVVSDTELTATTSARAIGVVSVTVRNADNQSAELARSFRFVDPPSLASLAPTSGDITGGSIVRLTGLGFTQGSTVTFGGIESTQVTLVSPTELDAIAPAHAVGAVDVVVSVEGATASLTGAYTYTRGSPMMRTVAPAAGPIEGGTLVTVTGTGFADGATVTIGGAAATSVVVVSGELLRAVTPAHAAGAVDIVVTNDDTQAGALSGGFTFTTASSGPDNSIADGGSGAVGTDPTHTPTPGGVSCGCTSFDGSMFGFAGLGLVALLSRRRRRS